MPRAGGRGGAGERPAYSPDCCGTPEGAPRPSRRRTFQSLFFPHFDASGLRRLFRRRWRTEGRRPNRTGSRFPAGATSAGLPLAGRLRQVLAQPSDTERQAASTAPRPASAPLGTLHSTPHRVRRRWCAPTVFAVAFRAAHASRSLTRTWSVFATALGPAGRSAGRTFFAPHSAPRFVPHFRRAYRAGLVS